MAKNKYVKLIVGSTVFLIFVVLFAMFLFSEIAPNDIEKVFTKEEFDHLPQSASNLHTGGGSFWYSDEYISFNASKDDIYKFITNSPALKGVNVITIDQNNINKYHFTNERYSSWYNPNIQTTGSLYWTAFNHETGHFGEILIDNSTDTVYINFKQW